MPPTSQSPAAPDCSSCPGTDGRHRLKHGWGGAEPPRLLAAFDRTELLAALPTCLAQASTWCTRSLETGLPRRYGHRLGDGQRRSRRRGGLPPSGGPGSAPRVPPVPSLRRRSRSVAHRARRGPPGAGPPMTPHTLELRLRHMGFPPARTHGRHPPPRPSGPRTRDRLHAWLPRRHHRPARRRGRRNLAALCPRRPLTVNTSPGAITLRLHGSRRAYGLHVRPRRPPNPEAHLPDQKGIVLRREGRSGSRDGLPDCGGSGCRSEDPYGRSGRPSRC